MRDEDGRSEELEAPPMTESREIPPLIVRRDALVFSVGDRSVTVKLSALLEKGDGAVVGLLLWGILLTLHDLETDFRRAIEAGEKRAGEALGLAQDPGKLLDHVAGALEKLGIPLPVEELGDLARKSASSGIKRPPGDGKPAP